MTEASVPSGNSSRMRARAGSPERSAISSCQSLAVSGRYQLRA
jgi:hypothetical protein